MNNGDLYKCLSCKKSKPIEEIGTYWLGNKIEKPYKYCRVCRKNFGKYLREPLHKLKELHNEIIK